MALFQFNTPNLFLLRAFSFAVSAIWNALSSVHSMAVNHSKLTSNTPPNGEASSTHTIQHCFISITLWHSSFIRLYFCSALITLKSLFACLSSLLECTFMRIKDLVWPVFCYVPSAQQYLCVADAPKICAKGTKLGQTLVADATCPGGKQFKKHNTGSLPARGLHLYYAVILRIIQCWNVEIELRGHHLLLSPFLPLAEWFWMASICTMNFFFHEFFLVF